MLQRFLVARSSTKALFRCKSKPLLLNAAFIYLFVFLRRSKAVHQISFSSRSASGISPPFSANNALERNRTRCFIALVGIFTTELDERVEDAFRSWLPLNNSCGLRFLFVRGRADVERNARDTIYLDVQENMNNGKSQAWFKWGSVQEVDMVFKMDTDTAVCPHALQHLLESKREIDYVGFPWPQHGGWLSNRPCGGNVTYCPSQPWYYMSGGFYGMSARAARAISAAPVILGHEDAVTGYLIHTLCPTHTSYKIECLHECRLGTETTCKARACPVSHLKYDKTEASRGPYTVKGFCD